MLKLAPPKYRVSRPRPGPQTLHCDGEERKGEESVCAVPGQRTLKGLRTKTERSQ